MHNKALSVEEYIESLPEDKKETLKELRRIVLKNLPEGYEEIILWGMISYVIPLSRYPETYNKQPLGYISIALQKNYFSMYLLGVYGDKETEEWFESEYAKSGKKLDMGKSCLRFKSLDDLPLDLIEKVIARFPVDKYIEIYERAKKK